MKLWVCLLFICVAFGNIKADHSYGNEYFDYNEELQQDGTDNEDQNLRLFERLDQDLEDAVSTEITNEETDDIKLQFIESEPTDLLNGNSVLDPSTLEINETPKETDKSADTEPLKDQIENIEDFDSGEGFSLEEGINDQQESDMKVFDDIETYRKHLFADYQFEDNRSEIKESDKTPIENKTINKKAVDGNQDTKVVNISKQVDDLDNIELDDDEEEMENNIDSAEDKDTMSKEPIEQEGSQDSEIVNDDGDTLSVENVNNIEETDVIDSDGDTMSKEINENDPKQSQNSQFMDKDDDTMSKEHINDDEKLNSEPIEIIVGDDEEKGVNEYDKYDDYDDDTVDKVKADLDDDLKKLFETWDKLSKDSNENDDVVEYDDIFGKRFKPIKNYEDVDDEEFEAENSEIENIDTNLEEAGNKDAANLQDNFDAIIELVAQTSTQGSAIEEKKLPMEKPYGDDGISDVNPIDKIVDNTIQADKPKENLDSNVNLLTVDVMAKSEAEITSKEYNEQMKDFIAKHEEELDINSDSLNLNVAPVHITLSSEEATLITSPNYPDNYPTNNIIDWILEGDGVGIELNITDLSLRGAAGDYLLIIPGGQDATDTQGLVFSWQLNHPRWYRFFEVDKVFIRFVSGSGLLGITGFSLTVKHISPAPLHLEDDDVPEPEALLPPPTSTMSVNLGGITLSDFKEIREEFRRLIADMATLYINANGIDMGVNTTQEITQIMNATLCNIEWPNFENCVEVKFAVPLVYENTDDDDDEEMEPKLNQEDLMDMWGTYIYQDPFAIRLRRMGITTFSAPNDGRVMLTWLVMTAGVIVIMAILAYTLWHYSCFDNYTRMSAYNETDSMYKEKRLDDLYPTPHQTLPPLFPDEKFDKFDDKFDEKFDDSTTRVDMGGYTNRSYMRDDPYDSDEDIGKRDRQTSFSPRDVYNV